MTCELLDFQEEKRKLDLKKIATRMEIIDDNTIYDTVTHRSFFIISPESVLEQPASHISEGALLNPEHSQSIYEIQQLVIAREGQN